AMPRAHVEPGCAVGGSALPRSGTEHEVVVAFASFGEVALPAFGHQDAVLVAEQVDEWLVRGGRRDVERHFPARMRQAIGGVEHDEADAAGGARAASSAGVSSSARALGSHCAWGS